MTIARRPQARSTQQQRKSRYADEPGGRGQMEGGNAVGGSASVISVVANTAVVVWVVLLIFAPSLLWTLIRGFTVQRMAAGASASLLAVCLVAYVVSRNGYGAQPALSALAILLGIVLLIAVVAALSPQRNDASRWWCRRGSRWSTVRAIGFPLVIACWILVPILLALHTLGTTFGPLDLGNADLPSYVLSAQNIAASGFADSHHLTNVNLGAGSHSNYAGAIVLINFVSAATGLTLRESSMPALGVALTFLVAGVITLGKSVWRTSTAAVAVAALVGVCSALQVYSISMYFFASLLGVGSAAVAVAGLISLAQGVAPYASFVCIAAGCSFATYAYGFLGLPLLVFAPVAALALGLLLRLKPRPLVNLILRTALASAIALAASAMTLRGAYDLLRAQSNVAAGWSLPGLTSVTALVHASAIGQSSSSAAIVSSWGLIVAVVVMALTIVWRRGQRHSALIGYVAVVAGLCVVALALHKYGAARYQTWKLETYVLPLATVVLLPALAEAFRKWRGGLVLLGALGLAVLTTPWQLWWSKVERAVPSQSTAQTLTRLKATTELGELRSVNIRLPGFFLSMDAATVLDDIPVTLSQDSYFQNMVSLSTCTLTLKSMVAEGDSDYVDLGSGYVLLSRPSKCETR